MCVECDAHLRCIVWIVPAQSRSFKWALPLPASATFPLNAPGAVWAWRLAHSPKPQTVSREIHTCEKVELQKRTDVARAPSAPFLARLLGFLRGPYHRPALDQLRRVAECGRPMACAAPFAFTRPS